MKIVDDFLKRLRSGDNNGIQLSLSPRQVVMVDRFVSACLSEDASGHHHDAKGLFTDHHEALLKHGFKHAGSEPVKGSHPSSAEKHLNHYENGHHKITVAPKGSWFHKVAGKVKTTGNPSNLRPHLQKHFPTAGK